VTPEEALQLIRQGEGQQLEFKQSLAEWNQAIKSLCAFANAEGGTVFFGVSQAGDVLTVSIGAVTLDRFSNNIRAHTQAPLSPTIERLTLEGKEIVAATVPKHARGQLFYAFNMPLVRVGATNQVMTPAEQQARLMEGQEDRSGERHRPGLAAARALAGPGSKGVDALELGKTLAKSRDAPAVRAVLRETRAFFSREWPALIEKLNLEVPATARVPADQIYEHCLPYLQRFSPDAEGVEQFGLALVDAAYEEGLGQIFRILQDWISLSEQYHPGGSLRAVTGAPAVLALRALASWGAKAADDMSLDILGFLLTQPLETTGSTGQAATLPLVDRRDLFWPEGMLGWADLAVQYLQKESWGNQGLQRMFASQEDYLAGLSRFLFTAALIHDARHRDEPWPLPLYPGFKLIPRSSAALTALVKKLSMDPKLVEPIANMANEDVATFKAKWPERVRRLNDAKLGGRYDLFLDWDRVPEQI
jgi:hypothetical protein